MAACGMDAQPAVAQDEKAATQGNTSGEAGPPAKKARTKEAEELLSTTTEKQKESLVLQSSPEAILGIFRQLTRISTDAQREDDENKSAMLTCRNGKGGVVNIYQKITLLQQALFVQRSTQKKLYASFEYNGQHAQER
eukprot:762930-Hanusia_phi.AAC.4